MDRNANLWFVLKNLLGIDRKSADTYLNERNLAMAGSGMIITEEPEQEPVYEAAMRKGKGRVEEETPLFGTKETVGALQEEDSKNTGFEPPKLEGFQPPDMSKTMQKSIVSSGTSIVGQLVSDGHIEILGTIQGDVEAKGDVKICGKVTGNVKGNNVVLESCRVQGNIIAATQLTMDQASVLVGDIEAAKITVDGKVKGNISTKEAATFNKNALVLGDVAAELVTIEQGASLHGAMKIRHEKDYEKTFTNIE